VNIVYYLHVLGATVWVGGLITLGALVPAVRRATNDREVLRSMARRFSVVSWIALGIQVATGLWMAIDRFPWAAALNWKIGLVMISALLAAWHTTMAREQSPAVRGAIQGAILVLALVIVALATIV
jgi:putative copper export protein